jgi:DNA-directed RNA polymerase specialized sigma24 family protein
MIGQRPWLKAQSGHVKGYDPEPDIADGIVVAALARLKERDREALILVAWDGLTSARAAAVLGEPSDRFRQRLHRAGHRLRVQLDDELRGEEPARPHHDHAPTGGSA